jgi:hypothetical protein
VCHQQRARDRCGERLLVAAEAVLIALAHRIVVVGAAIVATSVGGSASSRPSNAAFHTRAGSLQLSATTVSRNAGGTV